MLFILRGMRRITSILKVGGYKGNRTHDLGIGQGIRYRFIR